MLYDCAWTVVLTTVNEMRTMRRLLLIPLALLAFAPAANATTYVAVDDQTQCLYGGSVNSELQAQGANVMRLIIDASTAGQGLPCIQAAASAGYKVYLTVGYNASWTPEQTASWFSQILPQYSPYLWAVSVGSEEDLYVMPAFQVCSPAQAQAYDKLVRVWIRVHRRHQSHRWHRVRRWRRRHFAAQSSMSCRPSNVGEEYLAVWNAVEPVLAQMAPQAIRVYGDLTPWGVPTLNEGLAHGLPVGAGAIAFHCYDTYYNGLQSVISESAYVGTFGVPFWCSEMAPSIDGSLSFVAQDSQAAWDAKLASVEAASPNLQMISYYNWPGF